MVYRSRNTINMSAAFVPVNEVTFEYIMDLVEQFVPGNVRIEPACRDVIYRELKSVGSRRFCAGRTLKGQSCRRVVLGAATHCHMHDPAKKDVPEERQCHGTTKSGSRCRRSVKVGATHCFQHRNQSVVSSEASEIPTASSAIVPQVDKPIHALKRQYREERDTKYADRFNDVEIMRAVMDKLVESKFGLTRRIIAQYEGSEAALQMYDRVYRCGIELALDINETGRINRTRLLEFEDLVDTFDAQYGDRYTPIPYTSVIEREYYQ